jgi:ubiquitin-like domain-containing CTD phosphatase 1
MPQLCFKWKNTEINIDVEDTDTVECVKRKLEAETYISAKKQKLLGLKTTNGKQAGDTATVSELQIKPGMKVMLMG